MCVCVCELNLPRLIRRPDNKTIAIVKPPLAVAWSSHGALKYMSTLYFRASIEPGPIHNTSFLSELTNLLKKLECLSLSRLTGSLQGSTLNYK